MSPPPTIAEILSKASENPDDTPLSLAQLDLDEGNFHRRLREEAKEEAENWVRLEVIDGSPFGLADGAREIDKASEAERSLNPHCTVACKATESPTIYFADKNTSFAVHSKDTKDGEEWHSFVLQTSKERQAGADFIARGGVFDSNLPEYGLTEDSTWVEYYMDGHTAVMTELSEICQDSGLLDRVGTDDSPVANQLTVVRFASSQSSPDSMTIEELHEWAMGGKLKPLMDALRDVEV